MATIELVSSRVNLMNDYLSTVNNCVGGMNTALSLLRMGMYGIDSGICDMNTALAGVSDMETLQDDTNDSIESLIEATDDFVYETTVVDSDAADLINTNKENFYVEYPYLRPECETERTIIDDIADGLATVGEFCREHFMEIVLTVVIVVGVVLAVVAVIASGGTALVPLLAGVLTYFGVSAGTAMVIATGISLFVAAVAVVSSIASATLNIIDLWGDVDNPTFKKWQTALNVISCVSNLFYSAGSIYCGIKGITNSSLRQYTRFVFNNRGNFVSLMTEADNYVLSFARNSSLFWGGLGEDGARMAADYAMQNGKTTLGMALREANIAESGIQAWEAPSISMALRSSGEVTSLVGNIPGASGTVAPIWNNFEQIFININPAVTGLNGVSRVFQFAPALGGAAEISESIIDFIFSND